MRAERRGVVLILALGCMTILAGLMASLTDASSATQKMISRREAELRAAQAADAGVRYAVARLRHRGLQFINNAVPPADPALSADDTWIGDLSTLTVTLQSAAAPHEYSESSFTVRVAPQPNPPAAEQNEGFVRANLTNPADLSLATRFDLTVTGLCTASDGRRMALKTITQTFVGANVIPVQTVATP